MKKENIHTLGRAVVGTTVAVSTVLASVSHYYFYNKCLDWFNFEPKTHQDQNTPPIVTNYEQAICFTAPFITDFVIIAGSVQCIGTLFFGTSFKFWQPFANMLNAGGIASCLNSENAANDEHFTTSSIAKHSTQGSINEWLSNVEPHPLSNNDNFPACESFTDSIESNVDLPDVHATNFQQDPLSTPKTIEASGESTTALEPLALP